MKATEKQPKPTQKPKNASPAGTSQGCAAGSILLSRSDEQDLVMRYSFLFTVLNGIKLGK
jgi:hypothetical protein